MLFEFSNSVSAYRMVDYNFSGLVTNLLTSQGIFANDILTPSNILNCKRFHAEYMVDKFLIANKSFRLAYSVNAFFSFLVTAGNYRIKFGDTVFAIVGRDSKRLINDCVFDRFFTKNFSVFFKISRQNSATKKSLVIFLTVVKICSRTLMKTVSSE